MRKSYNLINIYIGKEFLFSFIVSFLFFFFLFFINQLLLLAEDILSKNVPLPDVLLLIFYSLPVIISFSFPFASLVGAFMTVGRLSADNEIMAFLISGVSTLRMFLSIFILGIIISFISFSMGDYFLPLGSINFGKLYRKVLYTNPQIELEPYSIKRYQDSIIITGEVHNNTIYDIVIIDKTPEKNKRTIFAKNAVLTESNAQQGIISLKLEDVFSHITDQKKLNEFEYFTSKEMIYNILLKDISFSVRNPGPREMSSIDVYREIVEKKQKYNNKLISHQQQINKDQYKLKQEYNYIVEKFITNKNTDKKEIVKLSKLLNNLENLSNKNITDRSLQNYKLEYHKKFAIPFGCLAFVVFAYPVGLLLKKNSRTVGFVIGLIVSIIYWGMLIGGWTLGLRMNFSPFLSMWTPNIIILLTGFIFFIIRLKR